VAIKQSNIKKLRKLNFIGYVVVEVIIEYTWRERYIGGRGLVKGGIIPLKAKYHAKPTLCSTTMCHNNKRL